MPHKPPGDGHSRTLAKPKRVPFLYPPIAHHQSETLILCDFVSRAHHHREDIAVLGWCLNTFLRRGWFCGVMNLRRRLGEVLVGVGVPFGTLVLRWLGA